MTDKVTTTKSAAPVDHNAEINKHLDAAKDAMVASGMSDSQAEAFLGSARPSGISTAVGNIADLQKSAGMTPVVTETVPTINEDRLAFASKVEADPGPPAPKSTF